MSFSIVLTAESIDEVRLLEVKEVLETIPGSYVSYPALKGEEYPSFIPDTQKSGALSESEIGSNFISQILHLSIRLPIMFLSPFY